MLEPKGNQTTKSQKTIIEDDVDENSSQIPENSFWTPLRVKALIGLIMLMSVILAVGFGFFIYKLAKTMLSNDEPEQAISYSSGPELSKSKQKLIPQSLRGLKGIKLDGYKIQHLAANEKEIILHVKKADKSQLWIWNKRAEKLTSKIDLMR